MKPNHTSNRTTDIIGKLLVLVIIATTKVASHNINIIYCNMMLTRDNY